jgi:hydroxymethylpyrimidine/phosphomethylpyrimidine kinase
MNGNRPPVALTIAGSDSSGGAGLQADLKTFHQHGVYGTSAVTLVTAQNTMGVDQIEVLAPAIVAAQIDAVAADFAIAAAKTGALGNAAVVAAVAEAVARRGIAPLVVDPVLLSKHGHVLLDADAVSALARTLLPLAALVTPNRPEAEALAGGKIETDALAIEAARTIAASGPRAVLIKGGHASGAMCADLLWHDGVALWLRSPRIDTPHTHGTGCTYAAAITASLARGEPLAEAVRAAHAWLAKAIATAPRLGSGHGPVNHWAE